MPFIGNQPALSYTSFAVQHFTTSATTSYTLDYSVANENEIRLVINNVVQQPGSSYAYTASGTTLTLSAATSATDTMYAVFLGKAVQTVTPASGSITNAMLGETITVANGGTGLTSGFKNGITEADQWRVTANITTSVEPISANLERVDSTGFSKMGTGMSVSSGYWSFPTTGLWLVIGNFRTEAIPNDNVTLELHVTTDNSTYTEVVTPANSGDGGTTGAGNGELKYLFNCTNTSTHKIFFTAGSISSGSYFNGNTDINYTYFTFLRLGDSQ
jgi:hypothetical protein